MARRPRYSSEFKAQAVRMVLEDGRKVCEVADQLVLSPDTLKNWLRAARAGKTFPARRADEKDLELERLQHEVRTLRMECEILKKAAAYFAKGTVKYAVITSMRSTYPLKSCCRLLGVSVSGYYKWRIQKPRQASYERDKLAVLAAHQKTRGCYGAVRLHKTLQEEGFALSLWRVKKIRHELGLVARKPHRRIRTTDSRHTFPVAANILQRNFSSSMPDRTWVSDITYIPTAEGWLYLAGIKDCCSKEIVGFHMSSHMDTTLVLKALKKAYEAHRPPHGLLLHSDRGSQYCSKAYQQQLAAYRMQCSMSRKGNCHDNAPMESFWGLLKNELVYRTHFRSRRQAKAAITEYIEIFYNRQRIQAGLGYLSPAAFAKNFWRGKAARAA